MQLVGCLHNNNVDKGVEHKPEIQIVDSENVNRDNLVIDKNLINGNYGLINSNGKLIVDYKFKYIQKHTIDHKRKEVVFIAQSIDSKKKCLLNSKGEEVIRDIYNKIEFKNDEFLVQNENNLFGVISKDYEMVIPAKYERISKERVMNEYKYKVKSNNHYGYLNLDGTDDIPIIYNSIFPDYKYYLVDLKGKYGLIGLKGQIIIEPQYELLIHLSSINLDGTVDLYAKKNNLMGIIDINNKEVIPLKYDKIEMLTFNLENNFIKVKKDKLWGIIDYSKNIIKPIEYEEIKRNKKNILGKLPNQEYKVFDIKI